MLLLMILPLNENVVGLGGGGAEGEGAVPLLSLQAHVQTNVTSRTRQPRLVVGMSA